jgi:hypothetical protein
LSYYPCPKYILKIDQLLFSGHVISFSCPFNFVHTQNNIKNFTNWEGLQVADVVGGELQAYLKDALAPGPLSLLCNAGNFGKIWSACGQREIQQTE